MANVLHKETLRFITSVNTPDYNTDEWIINPTLPNCEKKYWKISGNRVVKMTAAERQIVDDNIIAKKLEQETNSSDLDQMDIDLLTVVLVLLDEINKLRTEANMSKVTKTQLKTAVRTKYNTLK
jgi:hypothetical protein